MIGGDGEWAAHARRSMRRIDAVGYERFLREELTRPSWWNPDWTEFVRLKCEEKGLEPLPDDPALEF